ncbi:alpha/beta fold hydrolase [Parageobacillus thermoglucosidasius]|uniref:alpha/beta fold hydrolase n=1 Tax=Parageobacillus thermoglucosidasius TaxID=1426 RepID=UPI00025B5489|nr:alpha/beta hydrolase [Parageobacillus thermoglucosidasius]EID44700.1 2,6-dioxo-6-phenylhexa-3-enoate hydrolase [Parageobacillus thermoglucosidasius TNO-09.020]KYD16082.1 2-hydroxymuconic semialdehyde hydrolase [Anoxybacillus flavithermus]OAO87525.1 2-hydroxymuconic semialdehyde hydrolase [Parageobacillus thermoglucosidasius]OUM91359.1 MAG: 2-hydroxy-6-oxo-6-phenylhexa-2,4-dienoate hydrolase [Parageobacillus thermoglucosidasius]
MQEVTSAYAKTGAYETYFYRAGAGNGEAILFIHGSGPGATAWSNWQYALPFFKEKGFDCIAPDLIGFGMSEHPSSPPKGIRSWMRLWVDQLELLLDALAVKRTHLVGNSLGGAIALHLLAEAPERIDRVVLMGPAGAPFRLTPELDRVWGFYEDPSAEGMAQMIRWFAYDESFIEDQLADISKMRFEAAMNPSVRRSYEAMFPPPRQQIVDDLVLPSATLRRIRQPVLLVHGLNDPIVPAETSYYLAKHLPRVKMMIYGQCSHWTQVEYKDSFHSLLLHFFTNEI